MQYQKPVRRPKHRRVVVKRPRIGWRERAMLAGWVLVFGLFVWAAVARAVAPKSNTNLTRFDAIIVLGTPADGDGNPTPRQLARVTEGVREYERGVAPRMILTGGPAGNRFIEAQVMARMAEADGIPESAIYVEPKAKDTIENACFAVRIMKAHGWRSAEVVSSEYHLARAAMIFDRLPVEWRVHEAPPLEPPSAEDRAAAGLLEIVKTARYLLYARWTESCEP